MTCDDETCDRHRALRGSRRRRIIVGHALWLVMAGIQTGGGCPRCEEPTPVAPMYYTSITHVSLTPPSNLAMPGAGPRPRKVLNQIPASPWPSEHIDPADLLDWQFTVYDNGDIEIAGNAAHFRREFWTVATTSDFVDGGMCHAEVRLGGQQIRLPEHYVDGLLTSADVVIMWETYDPGWEITIGASGLRITGAVPAASQRIARELDAAFVQACGHPTIRPSGAQ